MIDMELLAQMTKVNEAKMKFDEELRILNQMVSKKNDITNAIQQAIKAEKSVSYSSKTDLNSYIKSLL